MADSGGGDESHEERNSLRKPWANEPLLSQTLYAFGLPSTLVTSLQLRNADWAAVQEDEEAFSQGESDAARKGSTSTVQPAALTGHASSACAVCPNVAPFDDPAKRRVHLRSDWHRYNAGLSKRGQQEDALSEEAFHKLIEDLSSADSAFEEDDEDRERAPIDAVSTLLARLRLRNAANQATPGEESSEEEDDIENRSRRTTTSLASQEPHLWFVTPSNAEKVIAQTQFGIVRQLLPPPESDVTPKDWHAGALARMQPAPLPPHWMRSAKRLKGAKAAEEAASMLGVVFMDGSGESEAMSEEEEEEEDDRSVRENDSEAEESSSLAPPSSTVSVPSIPLKTWTIILLGGGDFSAIVVALNPFTRLTSKRKGTTERQLLVVARKQFHRYTTRRKQGGSQAAQDATGRMAKSAGSSLRRYGEQQLGVEIRALLDSPTWRSAIQSSERVWIRAGLRSARGVLWGWSAGGTTHESPLEVMRRRDLVRSLPIATRKPTVGECLRCFAEMTRVRVRHETDEELERRDAAHRAQIEGGRQAREEELKRRKERAQRRAERQKQQEVEAKRKGITAAARRKLDPIDQLRRERFVRLIEMVRKGKLESVQRHLERYEVELLRPNGEWTSSGGARNDEEPDDVDESMALARRRIDAPLPMWWRYTDAREKGALLRGPSESIAAQIDNLTTRQRLVPSTLLQVAAEGGHEKMVSHLLIERKSDPTTLVASPPHFDGLEADDDDDDDDGVRRTAVETAVKLFPHRTAYDLCSSRDARDVFRRQMAAEPTSYDWSGMSAGGARVPKALTEEMEEARSKEEGVRDKRQLMRDRARKREEEQALAQAHTITDEDRHSAKTAPISAASGGGGGGGGGGGHANRLGGSGTGAPRALQKQRDEAAGLTPEMRSRIEREKRARAAEARLKSLQGS